jgi:hypothetical protein
VKYKGIQHLGPIACLILACNMTGYHDLGEPVNRFSQMGYTSVTYMRTFYEDQKEGVELFIMRDEHQFEGSCVSMIVLTDSVHIDVVQKIGHYEIRDGTVRLTFFNEYLNTYEERANPSAVAGAVQNILDSEILEAPFKIQRNKGIIEIGDHQFQRLDLVFDSVLTDSTAARADRFIKLYLLYTMVGHCRIEGFGGIGMLQYIGKTTRFDALLFGTMEFKVDGVNTITTEFKYIEHSDLTGMVFDGVIRNISGLDGTGTMDGEVNMTVRGDKTWQASVGYSSVTVRHSVANGGFYRLMIDGQEYEVSYLQGTPGNFDLSDVLPVDETPGG